MKKRAKSLCHRITVLWLGLPGIGGYEVSLLAHAHVEIVGEAQAGDYYLCWVVFPVVGGFPLGSQEGSPAGLAQVALHIWNVLPFSLPVIGDVF